VVERRFNAKDVIFTPGDLDDQLYFLLEGTVRLCRIYGDYKKEALWALFERGNLFPFARRTIGLSPKLSGRA
jgi:CRP-like cAMP-binding protein